MFWHFLRSFIRSVRANKILTLINVLSLSLGLTAFALAWLYVKWELSYDRGLPGSERIHRLVLEQRGLPGLPDGLYTAMRPQPYFGLPNYFPLEIESITRTASAPVRPANETEGGYLMSFVDQNFADIFRFEVIEGSLDWVLENPGMVALDESTAESLGAPGRVGQRLSLNTIGTGGEQQFEIGAIYRIPQPTSLSFPLLTLISDHAATLFSPPVPRPWENSVGIWLTLGEGIRAEHVTTHLPQFVESTVTAFNGTLSSDDSISNHLIYRLQPIHSMHLNPIGFEASQRDAGDKSKVLTFTVVGLLVLLVGCCNSVSLSLAQALKRRKEIGIRKASGAQNSDITGIFLWESVLLALLACAVAAAVQEILRPPVRVLLNVHQFPSANAADIAILIRIAAIIGLLNGIYPGIVLARCEPQSVLKQGNNSSQARRSFKARTALLGAQFSLAVMFLSAAAVLYAQLDATRSQPLGYNHRNVLNIESYAPMPDGVAMAQELKELLGVVDAVPISIPPNFNLPLSYGGVTLVAKEDTITEIQATRAEFAEGFLELMEIPLLAGRMLDSPRDDPPKLVAGATSGASIQSAIVNRRAAFELGFLGPEQAAGQVIFQRSITDKGEVKDSPIQIVGVVEDHQYMSLRRRPVPELYVLPLQVVTFNVLLRFEEAWAGSIEQRVREAYRENGDSLNVSFIDNYIELEFLQERSESRLLLIASGLALILSCIGLYGLALSIMERSVKEIGVRQALGATGASIAGLLLWRFSRPVLLSNLIAWPIAGWFVLRWIQKFPYQLEITWLPPLFLGASTLVLLIAWSVVSGVTARAALRPPVESLRCE